MSLVYSPRPCLRNRRSKKGKIDEIVEKSKNDRSFSYFSKCFGFCPSAIFQPSTLVKLLCRPEDPANLGVLRVAFGLLMMIDIPQERGMSAIDSRYGDHIFCHFPLFSFLEPLPLRWMCIAYLIMWIGAFGIMLGLLYRLSCILFLMPYWYFFFLDKTSWNNHSYLYGLLGILFMVSDADRYWSLDGLLFAKRRNSHVPLWNYTLFRTQIFLVYFIAGIKKLDADWVHGYSVLNLSENWVFEPFRLLLTSGQIDFMIHFTGLFLDLFMGFLLFFDWTRPFAFFFGGMFHVMNSQLFSIGMFPYAMLATMPLFCSMDWPKRLISHFPSPIHCLLPSQSPPQPSRSCIYSEDNPEYMKLKKVEKKSITTRSEVKHKIAAVFTLLYIAVQIFLPFSHFATKGYNNWTNGLYGYSWDMMVHTWSTQHVTISYYDLDLHQKFYLDPEVWTNRHKSRWSNHGDMIKQFASCIDKHLKSHNVVNVEIYFDVWTSLNNRFQQRVYVPTMDILKAPWNPFVAIPFSLPLLVDLSDWRTKLLEMEKEIYNQSDAVEVLFVADFPGMSLENFISKDLGNSSITTLKGEIIVELSDRKRNFTLQTGEKMQVPADEYHTVHTISSEPSCYMYLYVNTSKLAFKEKFDKYKKSLNIGESSNQEGFKNDPELPKLKELLDTEKKKEEKAKTPLNERIMQYIKYKHGRFVRSLNLSVEAVKSVIYNTSFEDFLKNLQEQEKRTDG